MAPAEQQTSTPDSGTRSQRSALKWLLGAAGEVILGILVTTPQDWLTRCFLVAILLLGTLSLWYLLENRDLKKDRDRLASELARARLMNVQTDNEGLSDLEYSLLCMLPDHESRSVGQFLKKLHRSEVDTLDALDALGKKGYVRQGIDSDYLGTGEWYSTKEGRDYVRKKKETLGVGDKTDNPALKRFGEAYFEVGEKGKPTGYPYCMHCWEKDKNRRSLLAIDDHHARCNTCNEVFLRGANWPNVSLF